MCLTSLDQSLTRVLEPRTSSPAARLRAIHELSNNGISVTVMVAPVIAGLNDSEIPAILAAAREHGASFAGYADHLRSTFKLFAKRYGLSGRPPTLDCSKFVRPSALPKKVPAGQMTLFDLNE